MGPDDEPLMSLRGRWCLVFIASDHGRPVFAPSTDRTASPLATTWGCPGTENPRIAVLRCLPSRLLSQPRTQISEGFPTILSLFKFPSLRWEEGQLLAHQRPTVLTPQLRRRLWTLLRSRVNRLTTSLAGVSAHSPVFWVLLLSNFSSFSSPR